MAKKIAYAALALLCFLPQATSAAALVAGIAFALIWGNPFTDFTRRWTSTLLQVAVVCMGFGMDLLVVGRVGLHGVGYTALTILLTIGLGLALGQMLAVRRDSTLLISIGTAICGGSAIAALSAAIQADNEDISVSLATVFLLNAVALILFPMLGHWMHLSPQQFGLWSALAVHDTSSVVGTSIQFGTEALQVGTTVKLARALWIVPLTILFAFYFQKSNWSASAKKKIVWPWFILGYIFASALVTWIPELRPAGQSIALFARCLLMLTLFFIGSQLTGATLRKVGLRPTGMGLALWIVVASSSLWAIANGWIHL